MDINEQKRIVARFLEQCNVYADDKLADYAARVATADADTAAGMRDKIGRWQTYKEFNEHALDELATDRLDDWFVAPPGT